MENERTVFDRVGSWVRNSVSLKLGIITFLILLLLIPTEMVKSIIYERQALNEATTEEVSSKWANSQLISGPIITIPVVYEYWQEKSDEAGGSIVTVQDYYYLLPSTLNIKGKVEPKKLRRGIYEVVVYDSKMTVSGSFDIKVKPVQSGLKEIKWEEAFITVGISDLRGIKKNVIFNWNEEKLEVQSGSNILTLIPSGITLAISGLEAMNNTPINFKFDLDLQGSYNLSFMPVGSTTNIALQSSWASPSFNGNFIPDEREVTDQGFTASWEVLQLNRNFPEYWTGEGQEYNLSESVFGVDFMLPMDDYQKSMRSAKYAVMTVVLTFVIFFLVEILTKRKIHPFQYTLVGLSLSLFYVLLISLSEHSNFNTAYLISAVAVVSMISLYSLSVFKSKKHSLLLVGTLTGIYGFLFVTLQLTDYALLMGSIGLTLMLSATMYFTRNINWYQLRSDTEGESKK